MHNKIAKFISDTDDLFKRNKIAFLLCLFFWGWSINRINDSLNVADYFTVKGTLLFLAYTIILLVMLSFLKQILKKVERLRGEK